MENQRVKTTVEIGVEDREITQLGREMGRTFDPRLVEAFERSLERVAGTFDKLAEAQKRMAPGGGLGAPLGAGGAGGGGGGRADGIAALAREVSGLREEMKLAREEGRKGGSGAGATAAGVFGGQALYGGFQRLMGMAPAAMSGNFASAALGAIPVFGPALGAAAQSSMQLFREHAQQQMAQASVFGSTGLGAGMNRLVGQATGQFGVAPGAVPGLIAQFAEMSGMRGGRLAGAFGTQMNLSQLLGVQGAGGLVQALEMSGGRAIEDPSAMMEDAVGAGIVAGFREAKLDRFISSVSGFVEDARSRGIPIDGQSVLGLFTGIAASGASFQGEAGAQFATNFGQAFGRAGKGRGFAQGLALRAAGFGSGATYQEALERIESRDPRAMAAFVESVRGMAGGDVDTGAYLIRAAMENLGMDMSAVQSRELFQNGLNISDQSFNREATQAVIQQRRQAAGGVFGAGAALGGIQLRRQAMGAGEVGATGLRLMNTELRVMSELLPQVTPILDSLNEGLLGLIDAYKEGGVSGLVSHIMRGVGEAIQEQISDALDFGGDVFDAYNNNQRNAAIREEQDRRTRPLAAMNQERDRLAREGVVARMPSQTEAQARAIANRVRQAHGLPALGGDAPLVDVADRLQMAAEELDAAGAALREFREQGSGALTGAQ